MRADIEPLFSCPTVRWCGQCGCRGGSRIASPSRTTSRPYVNLESRISSGAVSEGAPKESARWACSAAACWAAGRRRAMKSVSVSPERATVVSQAASVVLMPMTIGHHGVDRAARLREAGGGEQGCQPFGERHQVGAQVGQARLAQHRGQPGVAQGRRAEGAGGLGGGGAPVGAVGGGDRDLAEGLVHRQFHQLVLGRDVPVERGRAGVQPGAELAHAECLDAVGVQHHDRLADDRGPAERGLVGPALPAGPHGRDRSLRCPA